MNLGPLEYKSVLLTTKPSLTLYIFNFKINLWCVYYVSICLSLCMCMHMCVGALRVQQKEMDSLELVLIGSCGLPGVDAEN